MFDALYNSEHVKKGHTNNKMEKKPQNLHAQTKIGK